MEENGRDMLDTSVHDKNGEKLSFPPVIAMIDETNDLGSCEHGDEYILGATVIGFEFMDSFAELASKNYHGKELKFKDNPELREKMLKGIREFNPRVYAVTVKKPKFKKWNNEEQRNAHRNALSKLMHRIAEGENTLFIHMVLDENNKAKSGTVDFLRENTATGHGKTITSEIARSKNNFVLQTNDFVLGAMNKAYNQNDNTYLDILPDADRSEITKHKTKPIMKKE